VRADRAAGVPDLKARGLDLNEIRLNQYRSTRRILTAAAVVVGDAVDDWAAQNLVK
jgi:hypothetical protein